MDIERQLKEEKIKLEKLIIKLTADIAKYKKTVGNDSLSCSGSHGIPQYFINGQYASKKKLNKITAIAQKEYDEKLLSLLKQKLHNVEELCGFYGERREDIMFEKLCKGRKNIVKPFRLPQSEFVKQWIDEEYEPYNRWDDVKSEFYTQKGERVRSKTEKMIADELAFFNVPYKYEYPLELFDGKQKKVVRPDFVALNIRTLKVFILEHLGMMDKVGYYNTNLNKLDLYEKNGYLIGVNLIILHETSDAQVSVPIVRNYIKEFLL